MESNCATCRRQHPSNSVRNLYLGVSLPCSICLDDVPSENCWSLPCGHSNCKDCLRNLGFTDIPIPVPRVTLPETQNNPTEIPPNLICPQTQTLHRFQFDELTSSYINNYESFKCTHCNLINGECDDIYKETQRHVRERQAVRESSCHHEWRRTGGNYAMDINFYECSLCNGTMSN